MSLLESDNPALYNAQGVPVHFFSYGGRPPALQIVQNFLNAGDAQCPWYLNEADSISGSPSRALSDLFSRAIALEQVLAGLCGDECAIAAFSFKYGTVKDENPDSVPFTIDHVPHPGDDVRWMARHLERSFHLERN
jgi:hypothetical protein